MFDFFPAFSRYWTLRDWCPFSDIYCNITWSNAPLQFSHLWMFSTSPEQARWFYSEIADLLFNTIYNSPHVFLLLFQFLFPQCFFLL
uniref:Top1 n=1 Tax=Arundo donax TaxID=35708 RepID=A0A0A9GC80_ARUDO